MDPELKRLKKQITELDRESNESVLETQRSINKYTTSIGMYPESDRLKEDGLYGGRTHGRIGKMLEFYEARHQDSIFDSQERKRTDFFRDWIWTQPEDTLGVDSSHEINEIVGETEQIVGMTGARGYAKTKPEMMQTLKNKVKNYNKGGN